MFEVKNDPNYAAEIVKVTTLVDLPGLDNLKGLPMGPYTALVPKSTQVGDLLAVFPAEAQLSETYAYENNLNSSADLNKDGTPGYLGKNRRVKAIRLRGNVSSALAMPVASLPGDAAKYAEPGVNFDTISGEEISRKYFIPVKASGTKPKDPTEKAWRRADEKFLPEHFDTSAFWRSGDMLDPNDHVTVTQKLHGTSVRVGRTIVKRQLTWRDKVAQFFGVPVKDTEVDVIGGSRKVIKDPQNKNQNHYYGFDLWTDAAIKYGPQIPENVILYGELVGWVGDSPIQSGYTYNVPKGEYDLYVYRVAVIAPDGGMYDLSWDGVKGFCTARGLNFTPELWAGRAEGFHPEVWENLRYRDAGFYQAIQLSDTDTVDEGVCIRREGVVPFVLKAKSPEFFAYESKTLDEEKEILS